MNRNLPFTYFSTKTAPNSFQKCTITVKQTKNGTTSVSNTNPSVGEIVYVTAKADAGYMYGTRFPHTSKSLSDQSETFLYSNQVTWDGTTYKLSGETMSSASWSTDRTTLATKYHYTCFNSTGSCKKVYYITNFFHISFTFKFSSCFFVKLKVSTIATFS